jgi:La domain
MNPMMHIQYGAAAHPYQHEPQQFYQQQYPSPTYGDDYHRQHQQLYHPNDVMLFEKVKAQIEFYFRPQNLENDAFLQAQLNATEHLGAVPIHTICSFPKVRELCFFARYGANIPRHQMPVVDPNILRIALRESEVVVVSLDGMWISPARPWRKPQIVTAAAFDPYPSDVVDSGESTRGQEAATTIGKDTAEGSPIEDSLATSSLGNIGVSSVTSAPSSPSSQASSLGVPTHPLPSTKDRNTVIVRDIPDAATEAEVTEAFSSETVKPISVRPDVGNTWYITFESEEQAMSALSNTREKTISGAPISGRLKSRGRNSISVPTLPPMAPLHPPGVLTETGTSVNHSTSIASSTSYPSSGRSTSILSGSSYPSQSGIPLSGAVSQIHGYVTPVVAHGIPVPPDHPQYPIAYQMQQQQLFYQNYRQHQQQQQEQLQHRHQRVLYPRKPHTPQTLQGTSSASYPSTSRMTSPGVLQHQSHQQQHLQKQRRPQQQTTPLSTVHQQNGSVPDDNIAAPPEHVYIPPTATDSTNTQNLNQSHQPINYPPSDNKKAKNNRSKHSNKNKNYVHQNRPGNDDNDLGKDSNSSVGSATNNSHAHKAPNHQEHPTIRKDREQRSIAVNGNNESEMGTKRPGANPNRPKKQFNRSNTNYSNNNNGHNSKSKKYSSKKKGETSISTVELNGADFPALTASASRAAAGQSSLNPAANPGGELRRYGYAQAVLKMPSTPACENSKGLEASSDCVNDLTATMDGGLAFTETSAPPSCDEW